MVVFGTEQANEIKQQDRIQQLWVEQDEHLTKAVHCGIDAEQTGRSFANAVMSIVEMHDFDMSGFLQQMVALAIEENEMPASWYRLNNLYHALKEAIAEHDGQREEA